MGNAASAVWNHASGCAEESLRIKGEGLTFKGIKMICMDAISFLDTSLSKNGGLDFEANFEWLFTSLHQRCCIQESTCLRTL